jgi:murein L,D-transpeptidase YafK
MKRFRVLVILLAVVVMAVLFKRSLVSTASSAGLRLRGKATVSDRVSQYGEAARARLLPYFREQAVSYPPKELIFVGLKQEKSLELYAVDSTAGVRFIRAYSILAASGELGPKLRQGDRQVPEGIYRIESLNPNSRFHLSLRVNYPNEFDRSQARLAGRTNLGGDIMIHGNQVSDGCLAMGDQVAEELFVLAADTGIENIRVILAPVDFRVRQLPGAPPRLNELYDQIRKELARFRK